MALSPLVLAPNAFKGTASPCAAAQAMAAGVEMVFPGRRCLLRPLPDGGNGTLEVLRTLWAAPLMTATVVDAGGRPRSVPYAVREARGGPIALIESAQIVGMGAQSCPLAARTSAGLGELLRQALDLGIRRFYIGLGGSATWDAGAGLLAALGVRFVGAEPPRLGTLAQVRTIDPQALDARLSVSAITVLTDVDNGLCGPAGARLYAHQKGARDCDVAAFDAAISRVAALLEVALGRPAAGLRGAGAAGGLGFALALLGARLVPGAATIARLTGLSAAIQGAGAVVTGEGCCDHQTTHGKGPCAVAALARAHHRPVILICGQIAPSFAPLAGAFRHCEPLAPAPTTAAAISAAVQRALYKVAI